MALPRNVTVVGAGTMGAGIACVFAERDASVRLCARHESTLDRARDRLGATAALIDLTTDADEALAGADLVVETIVEDTAPKRALLERAEELAAAGAILTTNTSSLRLADLGEGLQRPERFAGLHWLNPPELVELVEIVPGPRTAPATLATLADWMRELGKTPLVVSRDVAGFVVNRLQYALLREAYALVEAGVCEYADVDRALTHGLGVRWAAIGPFQTMDLAGLDVHAAVAANLWPELANDTTPPTALERVMATGALGVKSGRGLLGEYAPADAAALVARRDRILRGVPALRDAT